MNFCIQFGWNHAFNSPETIDSLLSVSKKYWNVGSSRVKRSIAFAKRSRSFWSFGVIDIETTGSGTYIDSSERLVSFWSTTNVSPLAQSTPNKAKISPDWIWTHLIHFNGFLYCSTLNYRF